MFNIGQELNGVEGVQKLPDTHVEPEKGLKQVGWNHRDTVSSCAQNEQTETVNKTKEASWSQVLSQSIREWFFGSKAAVVAVDTETSQVEAVAVATNVQSVKGSALSESQQQDLKRVKDKFDLLMNRLNEDFPHMDIDEFMEILFYLDQESKKEDFEGQKIVLQEKYAALKTHRQEYQKLSEALAKELKSVSWTQFGQELTTVGTAALAAASVSTGWAIPIVALAICKIASSYNDNAVEHAIAKVAAKTGVVSEETGYNVIKGGVEFLILMGSVLGGGPEPTKLYETMKTLLTAAQVMSTAGNEYVTYKSDTRRGDVQFVTSKVQEGEKTVDRATQETANCSKRSAQSSSSLGEWARSLDATKRALIS